MNENQKSEIRNQKSLDEAERNQKSEIRNQKSLDEAERNQKSEIRNQKSLDEVIKALEICDETVTANCPDCPYDIDCENVPGEDLRADALHYLKEYKIKRARIELQVHACDDREQRLQEEIARYQEAVKNCGLAENRYKRLYEETSQKLEQASQNLPLTWEELKTMAGKPVWIEHPETKIGRWIVIAKITGRNEDLACMNATDAWGSYWKKYQGLEWQAYRKERG